MDNHPVFLSIPKIIYVTRQKRVNALIYRFGATSELLLHTLCAIFGVDPEIHLHEQLCLLGYLTAEIISALAKLFIGAGDLNAALFEVEIPKRTFKALVKQGWKYLAFELLRNVHSASRDRIKLVAPVLGGRQLFYQRIVLKLAEGFRKIQEHNVVRLHYYIINGYIVKRISDILHQIKHENLYVSFTSDR